MARAPEAGQEGGGGRRGPPREPPGARDTRGGSSYRRRETPLLHRAQPRNSCRVPLLGVGPQIGPIGAVVRLIEWRGLASTRQRRRRSRKLIVALALLIALVAIGGGADIGYAQVKAHAAQLQAALTVKLKAGQAELEAGKASLNQANAKHDANLVADATTHFAAARSQFLSAGALADNSALLRDLEMMPSFGSIVRSKHAAVSGLSA